MRRTLICCALLLGLNAPVVQACDLLGILGAPESCQTACSFGGHSAYYNTSCFFDLLIGW